MRVVFSFSFSVFVKLERLLEFSLESVATREAGARRGGGGGGGLVEREFLFLLLKNDDEKS